MGSAHVSLAMENHLSCIPCQFKLAKARVWLLYYGIKGHAVVLRLAEARAGACAMFSSGCELNKCEAGVKCIASFCWQSVNAGLMGVMKLQGCNDAMQLRLFSVCGALWTSAGRRCASCEVAGQGAGPSSARLNPDGV